jgi:hypothetical protein
MPLHRLPSEELRLVCRQKLETLELWLRRLIHEKLSHHFGAAYFDTGVCNNNPIFKNAIQKHVVKLMDEHPGRYGRAVDTLLLDYLVDTVCKEDLYKTCFKPPLSHAFPDGREEARTFLLRLVPIRNALSHANPISVHDAERVICYCDDVLFSLQKYYMDRNMGREYNAPLFSRFVDSLGHADIPAASQDSLDYTGGGTLRPGDSIRLEVEVDSSFDPETYAIDWVVGNVQYGETGTGTYFTLAILRKHVSERLDIRVMLKSRKEWHRHGSFDARLSVTYKVLPPIEG